MIEHTSIAYFTRTVLALRKKLTSSRQGAFDPGQPGQAGDDRADVAAAVEHQPVAEHEDALAQNQQPEIQRELRH